MKFFLVFFVIVNSILVLPQIPCHVKHFLNQIYSPATSWPLRANLVVVIILCFSPVSGDTTFNQWHPSNKVLALQCSLLVCLPLEFSEDSTLYSSPKLSAKPWVIYWCQVLLLCQTDAFSMKTMPWTWSLMPWELGMSTRAEQLLVLRTLDIPECHFAPNAPLTTLHLCSHISSNPSGHTKVF